MEKRTPTNAVVQEVVECSKAATANLNINVWVQSDLECQTSFTDVVECKSLSVVNTVSNSDESKRNIAKQGKAAPAKLLCVKIQSGKYLGHLNISRKKRRTISFYRLHHIYFKYSVNA